MDDLDPERLLEQSRAGDASARGRLLEGYREDLHSLARSLIGPALRVRLDASDLVQETLLEADRDLPQFQGSCELELTAWLRRIMVRNLANQANFHHRQRRDQGRHVSLDALLQRRSQSPAPCLSSPISSPSSHAIRDEQAVILANALSHLRPDQREVVVQRIFEHRSLAEIAAALDRSEEACRKLWSRALTALERELGDRP